MEVELWVKLISPGKFEQAPTNTFDRELMGAIQGQFISFVVAKDSNSNTSSELAHLRVGQGSGRVSHQKSTVEYLYVFVYV